MTVQEAYIQGFRKTAEAHRIDPGALAKYASTRVQALEQQAAAAMKNRKAPRGKTVPLDLHTQLLLQRLQAAKGQRIRGYDDATGFSYG